MADLTIRCDDLLCSRLQTAVGSQYRAFQTATQKLVYSFNGVIGDIPDIANIAHDLDPDTLRATIQGFETDFEGRFMAATDAEFNDYADFLNNVTFNEVPDLWECLQQRLMQFPILSELGIAMVETDNAVKLLINQLTSELFANLDAFSFFDDLMGLGNDTPFPNFIGSIEAWRNAANVLCMGAINNDADILMTHAQNQANAVGITSVGFSPKSMLGNVTLSASASARVNTMDAQATNVKAQLSTFAGEVLGKNRFSFG